MTSKQNLVSALTGISGILVSPMDDNDELATELQRPIVDNAIAAGVHILVANGNTGEFYALTLEEAETMVRAAAKHIAGRVPLLAGIGRGVKDACQLARVSAEAGADALMIHQPPDPFAAPRGLIAYVEAVHNAAPDLPIVLYLRNDTIGLDTIKKLCDMQPVVGVKWATGNVMNLADAIAATDPDIVWVGGLAETWAAPFYAVGARGFTSGLINVWPEQSVAIHTALEAGDYRQANKLVNQMKAFESIRAEEHNGTNVTGVKACLRALGHDCGASRPPSAWPLTDHQSKQLDEFVALNKLSFNTNT